MVAGASPQSQALDTYLAQQYEILRAVHDNLPAIRAVALGATPVTDLQDFQDQVTALYAQLGLLVEASGLLTAASGAGLALLDATTADAQRTLLGLGDIATHGVAEFATTTDFASLNTQLANLSSQLAALTLQKADRSALDALGTTVTSVQSDLAGTKNRVTLLEETVNDPATGVAAAANAANQAVATANANAGQLSALATEVANLDAAVNDPVTGLAAETTARQTLGTHVQQIDDTLAAQAASITQLQADAGNALSGVNANASALDALTTRVTADESTTAAQASLIDALTTRANNVDGTLAGQASALSSLNSQVVSNEAGINANAQSVTDLKASLSGSSNLLPNSGFAVDLSHWTFASVGVGWETGAMTRDLTGSTAFPPGVHTLGISSGAPAPGSDAGVYCDDVPVLGSTDYILSGYLAAEHCTARLQWRELDGNGTVVAYGEIGSSVGGPPANLSSATRVQLKLTTNSATVWLRVQLWGTNADPAATAPSKAWLFRPMLEQAVSHQVNASPWSDSVAGLDAKYAAANESLQVQVTEQNGTLATLLAKYSLTLDVNGYITGWTFNNDGTTGVAAFRADLFSITAPAGTKSVEFANGILSSKSVDHVRYMGVDFGPSSNFIDWFGPTPPTGVAGVNTASGVFWIKNDGSAYFGGTLSPGGVLSYLAGSGLNQMWGEYTHFWNTTLPTMTAASTLSLVYDSSVSFAADNSGALRVTVNDPTGNINGSTLYLGTTSSDYSTSVGPHKYIASGYFKSNLANVRIRLGIKTSDGLLHEGPDIDLGPANTQVRVAELIDLSGFAGGTGEVYLYFNRQGTTTSYMVWLDRLMIEEQIGLLATPSTWTPGRGTRLVIIAQADASKALSTLTDIASDNLLTPNEKPTVIQDQAAIASSQSPLDTQATALGITTEKTTFDNAISALNSYLATLTSPVLWNDLSGNTTIVGATFRQKFLDVYAAQQMLQAKIDAANQAKADAAQTAANNAQSTASTAQTNATNALNGLSDISSDNLLTPAEKKIVIADQAAISNEQSGIDAQATSFGIVTEKTTYDNAVTALNSYLATLTSPYAWNSMAGNTTIVRNTFKQKFLDVYSSRQALLNAVYTAAQNLANKKLLAVGDNLIPNPTFIYNDRGVAANTNIPIANPPSNICDGWVVVNDASATAGQSGQSFQMWHWSGAPDAIFLQVNTPTALANGAFISAQIRTERPIPVQGGQQYLASFYATQAWNGSPPAGVTVQLRMVIQWLDATNAAISTVVAAVPRSSTLTGVTESPFIAPSNAVSCHIYLDAYVYNGTGAAYTFDSTVIMRGMFKNVQLVRQIATTAQLPMLMYANGRAKVPTVITYSAASGPPATATINVAAFTIISGSRSISYNAMSVNLTHAAGTVQYFLYFDDPQGAGGAQTLVATTVGNDVYGANGRVYVGDCSVTFPSSGSTSGGGGRIDSCVCIDMFLADDLLAMEAREGLLLDCIDLPTRGEQKFRQRIQQVRFVEEECVEIRTVLGAVLRLSASTPFDLPGGRQGDAAGLLGEKVMTDLGWETVATVRSLGKQPVAHIGLGGISYAAGEDPRHRIYSHNATKP